MTRVKFYKDKDGNIVKYTVKGHAGYAEYGKDIVCAAISALALTGINALEAVCGINPEYKDSNGYLSVSLPRNIQLENKNKAIIVLETIRIGMEGIQEAYPKYMTLEYGEV